jgi:hypothetical protein
MATIKKGDIFVVKGRSLRVLSTRGPLAKVATPGGEQWWAKATLLASRAVVPGAEGERLSDCP